MNTILCFILLLKCRVLQKQTKDVHELCTRAPYCIHCWRSVHTAFRVCLTCGFNVYPAEYKSVIKKIMILRWQKGLFPLFFWYEGTTASENSSRMTGLKGDAPLEPERGSDTLKNWTAVNMEKSDCIPVFLVTKAFWNPGTVFGSFPLPGSPSSPPHLLSRAGWNVPWAGVFLGYASLTWQPAYRGWQPGQQERHTSEPLHSFCTSSLEALVCLYNPQLPPNWTEICWKPSIRSKAEGLQQQFHEPCLLRKPR